MQRTKSTYFDQEAQELFEKLKAKFGSHVKAAESMGLHPRTYADWRLRGFSSPNMWTRVKAPMKQALNGES